MDIKIILKCLIIQMEKIDEMFAKVKNEQLDFLPSVMVESVRPPAV